MASMYDVLADPALKIQKATEVKVVAATPVLGIQESEKKALRTLERSVNDSTFIAQWTYQDSKAPKDYDLISKKDDMLLGKGANQAEVHIGKLGERFGIGV